MDTRVKQALVIGGGPAGLMVAGELARGGVSVILAEAKPTVARKFLMAGKSGLNLTKDEPLETFVAAYHGSCADLVHQAVRGFGPEEVARWAENLGQEVFTGSSGRVFPRTMKGSPLLRAWLAGLGQVDIRTRWRWEDVRDGVYRFDTPEGPIDITPDVAVFALGGASWPRLGSDGTWAKVFDGKGVPVTPLMSDNAGVSIEWSDHMSKHFGAPVKAARLTAGDMNVRGEFVLSRRGLEGSAVYAVNRPLRNGAPLAVDLLPDWSEAEVATRLARPRGKASLSNHLRKVLRLDTVRMALLMEFGRPLPDNLAPLLKRLPIPYTGLRPVEEAISTAGGISAEGLDGYAIRAMPGAFAAGEMLDWEAPTGGYLLTACLATGRAAARQALTG